MFKNISYWISPFFFFFFLMWTPPPENNPSNPGIPKDSQSIGFWEMILNITESIIFNLFIKSSISYS